MGNKYVIPIHHLGLFRWIENVRDLSLMKDVEKELYEDT